ncbi:MAG: phosphocholine cytidylyltransferase family protein [Lysobacterales bacterium]|jgi:choline kinase
MQAIILAAGQGKRLAGFNPEVLPTCLLEIGGRSLLERQLETLFHEGIRHVTLVTGFKAGLVVEHVGELTTRPEVAFVYNPAFDRGSVLSLLAATDALTSGDSVLVLDAGVLFHPRIMQTLIESPHGNCFLIDRDFNPPDGATRFAMDEEEMAEFRNSFITSPCYEVFGRSLGLFKFDLEVAAEIARACEGYEAEGLPGAPYEESLRDVLLANPANFGCEDVGGLPWVAINHAADVERADGQVLPAIRNEFAGY